MSPSWFTIECKPGAQVVLDDLNQVTAAVALRTPDLCEPVPEGRRELSENRQAKRERKVRLHAVLVGYS